MKGGISWAVLVLLVGRGLLSAAEGRVKVQLEVMDTHGNPLKHFKLTITNVSRREVPAITVIRPGPVMLEPDLYEITGEASLHHRYRRRVIVSAREKMLLVVAFSPSDMGRSGAAFPSLPGRLRGADVAVLRRGECWLKTTSLFGEANREAQIDSEGKFEIPDLPYGDYVVTVFQGKRVIHTQRFENAIPTESVEIVMEPARREIRKR